ncbi:MAG: hypothetical protein WB676_21415 [Bryobacteraceae bacterium]
MTTRTNGSLNLNFEALIQKLVIRGTETARSTLPPPEPRPPTSIRLKPSTRHFIDCQAESLGASAQAVIGMILDGVAESTLNETSAVLRTIRERFFYLFEAHHIDMPGIVSVLKEYGFRLSTLSNGDALLDLLTTDAIRYISELFHIERGWLSGSSEYMTSVHSDVRWYKNQRYAFGRIIEYNAQGLRPHVIFIRRINADFEKARQDPHQWREEPIGIVIKLHLTTNDGIQFETYELWEFQHWNYWRSRYHIKHLIALCEAAMRRHTGIDYVGYELSEETIEKICGNKVLPASVLGRSRHIWQPDDYAGEQYFGSKETDEWEAVRRDFGEKDFEGLLKEAQSRSRAPFDYWRTSQPLGHNS